MLKFTKVKLTTKTIETKYAGHRFLIDIVESENRIEAWIYTANMGVKDYMFGVLKENHPAEDFIGIVKDRFEEYADLYLDRCSNITISLQWTFSCLR